MALQIISVACLIAFAVSRTRLPDTFTVFAAGKRGAGMFAVPTDFALAVSATACAITVAVAATMLTWLLRSRQQLVPREAVSWAAVLEILGSCMTIGLTASALSGWPFAAATVLVTGAVLYMVLETARRRADDRWLLDAGLDEIAAARRQAGLAPYAAEAADRRATPAPPAR